MRDRTVWEVVEGAATEATAALRHRCQVFSPQDLADYCRRSLERFGNTRLRRREIIGAWHRRLR